VYGQLSTNIFVFCHQNAAPGHKMKVNNISFESVSETNQCYSLMLLVCVGMKIVFTI